VARHDANDDGLFSRPFAVKSTDRMVEELLNDEACDQSLSAAVHESERESAEGVELGVLDVPQQLLTLKTLVEDNFPALWLEVEAALSVAAILRLKNAPNPVCLIYEGDPASGKSTVAEMFAGFNKLTYLTDKFSPAAFVSHAANRTRKALQSIDLLPKIQHKLLITPEMGPTFSGKDNELEDKFSTLTRVLDGRGLATDSGTQGRRGYQGDYFFTWIGCTTPISDRVWKIMGKLGSRIVTWKMPSTREVTVEDLLSIYEQPEYLERLTQCVAGVSAYLAWLFECPIEGGATCKVRDVSWKHEKDSKSVLRWIARAALLMARMRSEPAFEPDPDDEIDPWGNKRREREFIPGRQEGPHRFQSLLREVAQGHALVYGRRQLSTADLPVVVKVALSSMPAQYATVFLALAERAVGADGPVEIDTAQVQTALRAQHPGTARKLMERLGQYGVLEFIRGTPGGSCVLKPWKDWEWCTFTGLEVDDAR
jgi:hypothetical protein